MGNTNFKVDYLSKLKRPPGEVDLFISYDSSRYQVKPYDLSSQQKAAALDKPSKNSFQIRKLFEYFQIENPPDHVVDHFNPPITITLKYSRQEWEEASQNGRPRVGYLIWVDLPYSKEKDDPWNGAWTEIDDSNIVSLPPNHFHDEGYLIISFDELIDPLIGGC